MQSYNIDKEVWRIWNLKSHDYSNSMSAQDIMTEMEKYGNILPEVRLTDVEAALYRLFHDE